MKRITSYIITILIFGISVTTTSGNNPKYPEGFKSKASNGIRFTENKGQVCDQNHNARPDVLYSGTDGPLNFHLKSNGISYQLNRVDTWKKSEDVGPGKLFSGIEGTTLIPDQTTIFRLDINWLYADTKAKVTKGNSLDGYNNYYLEQCPNGALNVKSFENVMYQNIYTGIDLKWYQKEGHLKYDYIVAAGADYKQIQLQIKGAEKISISHRGELVLKTPLGDVIEEAPLVMQKGKELRSKWLIKSDIVSFEIEGLDSNYEYVIDPLVRNWGTYYGAGTNDYGNSCSTDKFGDVYMAGWTDANAGTIIATAGSHQTTIGGQTDAFLVKFNSSGQRLWGTYYGGSAVESDITCANDKLGNVYLSGSTASTNSAVFVTSGAHQSAFGGQSDAFLVKFSSLGQRQWGTYYGGSQDESARSCAADTLGNVYMCGWTVPIPAYTGTALATVASHQSIHGGGTYDAFLVKFNPSGIRLWASYYGGSDMDWAYSCATDLSGNIYMSGVSGSNTGTIIATAGSHQSTSVFVDAYLVKFNSLGQRMWGTYYGGASGGEEGLSCTTDFQGNVFLAGNTNHSNADTVIASGGGHQPIFAGGSTDAFLAKFNSAGTRQWATYYGGYLTDNGFSCATNTGGDVYLTGHTQSDTGYVISTNPSYQKNHGGQGDAYLVKFNSQGQRQWGTYYGSIGDDWSYSCAANTSDIIYMAGYSNSDEVTNGPVIASSGGHQAALGGSFDAFLVQFHDCTVPSSPINTTAQSNLTICAGMSTTLTASGSGILNWFSSPSASVSVNTGTFYNTPTLSSTTTYYVENVTCAPSGSRTAITVAIDTCTDLLTTKDETLSVVKMYPNPFSGEFTIETPIETEITIVNTLGQPVLSNCVIEGKNRIDLKEQASGIYFVQIKETNKMFKLIKE